jgi:hypothetical protein
MRCRRRASTDHRRFLPVDAMLEIAATCPVLTALRMKRSPVAPDPIVPCGGARAHPNTGATDAC